MPRCPNPRCQMDYPAGTVQCTNPFCQCLLPEAIVAGRYRIETLIGMGGMGAVYRASDTFEMQQVALKILSLANTTLDLPTAAERFRREARYAHQLQHKNIVPVLNFGQDNTLLYIAMPLVTGGTLKSLLKNEQPLPTQLALRYLDDLAAAIDAIHSHPQQIIHRDIKPSNLLIHQDDGRLVVTDFGIARAVQQEKPLTVRGWTLGTEHYIAPEQEDGRAEPASDIYAMGVVAYQIFTGLLPFQAVVKSHKGTLPSPSHLNASLPPTVDAVVMRAMDIDPRKRFKTAQAFVEALHEAFMAEETPWSAPTIAEPILADTIVSGSNANVVVRTIIPENPCGACGRENRSGSRFCRYCGHALGNSSPLLQDVCQVGYKSDAGRQAQENEDMLLVVQGLCTTLKPPARPFSLLAVADGLGGPHGKPAGGHDASRLAVDTIADVMLPLLSTTTSTLAPVNAQSPNGGAPARKMALPTDSVMSQWLRDAIRQANKVIYHCNADYDTTMASTVTASLIYKHHLYVAGVGDSRVYQYNANKGLTRVTTENGQPRQNLVPASVHGANKNQHAQTPLPIPNGTSPESKLGQNYQVAVDVFDCAVEVGDLILLCTDGLWKMLPDERIKELLAYGGDPQMLALILVEAANSAGGAGNVSAIVARIQ